MKKFDCINDITKFTSSDEMDHLLSGYSPLDFELMAVRHMNLTGKNLPNKSYFGTDLDMFMPVDDMVHLLGLTEDEITFLTFPLNVDADRLDRLLATKPSKVFKIVLGLRVEKLLNNMYFSGAIDRYSSTILWKALSNKHKKELRRRLKLTPLFAHGRVSAEVAARVASIHPHLPNKVPKRAKGYEAEWLMRANQGLSTHHWSLLYPALDYAECTCSNNLDAESTRLYNSGYSEFHDCMDLLDS